MRVAIYHTPAQDDPLTRRAALWLGRDAFDGCATRAADPAIDPLVSDPARYGFHATLKAPFRLADGRSLAELDAALKAFAQEQEPVALGPLALARIGSFLALAPTGPVHGLSGLETGIRTHFEPFRAQLTEAEIARRRPDLLTASQRANLDRWGYPHVGADFRFHMTLSNALDATALAEAERRIRADFADLLPRPLTIDAVALFIEPDAGAPFHVHARHPFAQASG